MLRAYEEAFAPLLFEAASESRGGEFSRWMPWCHERYAIEDSRAFAARAIAERPPADDVWRPGAQFVYAIFDAATGRLLGNAGLNQPNKIHKFFNLGYWVRASAQQRGVASRAARALAGAAFADLPVNRLELLVAVENLPSQRTAEKAGAKREGVLRQRLVLGGRIHDAVMYSFVREDFRG